MVTSPLQTLLDNEIRIIDFSTGCATLRLREPMNLPFGAIAARPSGWAAVTLETREARSVEGFGEGATLPQPLFTQDSASNIAHNGWAALSAVEAVDELQLSRALGIVRALLADTFPTAAMMVEVSILDAAARANGYSMAQLVGIPSDLTGVPFGTSIGGFQRADLDAKVDSAIQAGTTKIKLKVSPLVFDHVMGCLKRLESQGFRSIMVDANGTFNPLDSAHLFMLDRLDQDLDLIMIEEPVSRVGAQRGLDAVRTFRQARPAFNTPIALDDCLTTAQDCRIAIADSLADVVNIKPGRIGSFLECLVLIDEIKRTGKQVMIGGMLEATPGRCVTTILAAYCLTAGFTIPGDISLAQHRLLDDFVDEASQMQATNTRINVPRGIGFGYGKVTVSR